VYFEELFQGRKRGEGLRFTWLSETERLAGENQVVGEGAQPWLRDSGPVTSRPYGHANNSREKTAISRARTLLL
jgi:hypothetical protein